MSRAPSDSAPKLKRFLADPSRPPGTLTYHELQGFLFAVAAAPDLVRPSEWMPMIFGETGATYQNIDEARMVMAALTEIYNSIVTAINDQRPALPTDCRFHPETLANLETDAPISQWSRGFTRGHLWLEESWDVPMPKDMAEESALIIMALGFFASRKIADSFARETKHRDMPKMAETMRELFPEAIVEYARMGRIVREAQEAVETAPSPVTRPHTTGRNDPCPCGSGRKYKKCCGSADRH